MSTPAQVTEAHRALAEEVMRIARAGEPESDAAKLIADSEARATSQLRKEIDWLQLNNDMLTDNPKGHARALKERADLIAERDQLRAEVNELNRQLTVVTAQRGFAKERAEKAEAEVERLKRSRDKQLRDCVVFKQEAERNQSLWRSEQARAERAEAILGKLQELHGCSQEMVVYWSEHAHKRSYELVKAQAELAKEQARLVRYSELLRIAANNAHDSGEPDSFEDAINAAIKEDAK